MYTSPHVGCISGCDYDFLQVLNINRNNSTSLNQTTTNSSNAGSTNHNNSTNTSQNRRYQNNTNANPSTAPSNPFMTSNTTNTRPTNPSNSIGNRGYGNTNNFTAPSSQQPTSNSFNDNNTMGRNWFSGTNDSGTPRQPPSAPPTNGSFPNDTDNHVVCNCGESAVLLTVRKASPNMGWCNFIH